MTPMQEGFYSLERNYKTLRWKLSVPIELDTSASCCFYISSKGKDISICSCPLMNINKIISAIGHRGFFILILVFLPLIDQESKSFLKCKPTDVYREITSNSFLKTVKCFCFLKLILQFIFYTENSTMLMAKS